MHDHKSFLLYGYKFLLLREGFITEADMNNEERCRRRWTLLQNVPQKTIRRSSGSNLDLSKNSEVTNARRRNQNPHRR